MSDSDLYEATFDWYHPEANKVVITGLFDNWTGSTHLKRIEGGWETKVMLPWGQKTLYKYLVDDKWTADPTKPIEYDHEGNANNVYITPPKPESTSTTTPGAPGVVEQAQEMASGAAQFAHATVVAPIVAAVGAAVPVAAVAGSAARDVEPAPEATPLVDAAASMPPSTPQKTLDQVKAAVHAVQEMISPTAPETSDAKAVELHSKEGVAAPLHDAAARMPSTAQAAMTSASTAIQNALPEGTTEQAKALGEIVSEKAGEAANHVNEAATVAAGAVAVAAATAASAIPEEHKQTVEKNIINPVKEAVASVVPESKANGETGNAAKGALAYVASGIGAAIKTVTGVDPINADKIPVQTPKAELPPAEELPAKVMTSEAPAGTEANPTVAIPAEPLKLVDEGATVAKEAPIEAANKTTQPEVSTHIPLNPSATSEAKDAPQPTTSAEVPAITPEATQEVAKPPPETPQKQKFPSEGESSTTSTPSKSETPRKKRQSLIGKIKHMFHHDKHDKDKSRKASNPQ